LNDSSVVRRRASLGPNLHLVGKRHARSRLWTPALVLDLDAFEYNAALMAEYCRESGVALRPHAKTHKCTRIAEHQLRKGAIGISVATVREALIMAGVSKSILITSPVVGEAKLDAIASLVERVDELIIVLDSVEAARRLERRLKRSRRRIGALIDIDPGMKRTGVSDVRDALELARFVRGSSVINLVGVQCYSGMVQHIAEAPRRANVYRRELRRLETVLEHLERTGFRSKIVSGGGTGTFDLDRRSGIFTECQAGSYIFMDAQYNAVELFAAKPRSFKTALYVQSMVLSNNHQGAATIDAGFKSFAMDGPIPVPSRGAPPSAAFQYYGDEFGRITFQSKRKVDLGTKVEFVTPHCDPTVNLHDFYHCVRGERLVDIWPIDARGTL